MPNGHFFGEYLLVADIWDVLQKKPRTDALFLEICDVYGFSGNGWTPMMWKLKQLYEGPVVASIFTDQWQFEVGEQFTYEFLYLQCDHNLNQKGTRRAFGPKGRYNATLLYPDAWSYFKKHMS
jgi:hypothetical protein